MDEIPYDIFLNIGNALCNINNDDQKNTLINNNIIFKKTYEEYKNNYKSKLEVIIENNKKKLNELEIEISNLERKITDIIRVYFNKKFKSASVNFIYTNKPIINYLMSLNSLDCEKMKYYKLTVQNLKEEQSILTGILEKNLTLLSKV